ncbi:phage holin family protein [Methylobacterium sp. WL103]|uniref:phage holin family protein n=1 Tax=unclassified Methylobacterium TaxID=2615210 RepID=UPI0011C77D0D|nr:MULTISPECIES: phage holin family protein [unclassified Methylobacterium]TXM71433.1 phage holin family protein [Methylobacterium sp. WL12]TXN01121.1 phage holin family protein [Methylobacterium sp. WL103]
MSNGSHTPPPGSSSGSPAGSIQSLIGDALRETNDLARKEIALFRAEMAKNVRSLIVGIVCLMASAVFSVVALLVLIGAFVKWLATIVGSEWLSALIVGGVLLVLAIGMALWGRSALSFSTLAPTRTGRQVRQDARALSERVSG